LTGSEGRSPPPKRAGSNGFTQGEDREVADEFMRGGIEALKVNRRGLEAECRSEIKRVQAKISELVLDNKVRKKVLGIVRLDESERRSIDLLLATRFQKPESADS
jgi:hypothetical protein